MPTPRLASADRRVQLADAALKLIATQGLGRFTTRSLADKLGLSAGALFRHFKSLDEVLEAVVERIAQLLTATFPAKELPPLTRLTAFAKARSAAVDDRSGILRLLVSEQFLLHLPPKAAARLKGLISQSRAFVLAGIVEGQQDGSIRRDIPAEDLALLVLGLIQMQALSRSMGLGLRRSGSLFSLQKILATGSQRSKENKK